MANECMDHNDGLHRTTILLRSIAAGEYNRTVTCDNLIGRPGRCAMATLELKETTLMPGPNLCHPIFVRRGQR